MFACICIKGGTMFSVQIEVLRVRNRLNLDFSDLYSYQIVLQFAVAWGGGVLNVHLVHWSHAPMATELIFFFVLQFTARTLGFVLMSSSIFAFRLPFFSLW
jgi:hypothetical protein